MIGPTILDSGPLVAFLDRRDHFHAWAETRFEQARFPLITCEAVLVEAYFILRRTPEGG